MRTDDVMHTNQSVHHYKYYYYYDFFSFLVCSLVCGERQPVIYCFLSGKYFSFLYFHINIVCVLVFFFTILCFLCLRHVCLIFWKNASQYTNIRALREPQPPLVMSTHTHTTHTGLDPPLLETGHLKKHSICPAPALIYANSF